MLGTTEALIIGGIILLLFGAKKLPELAKSLGQSKAAFDEGVAEGAPPADSADAEDDEDDADADED
ncbi:MAG: twin-arginine translocase TatA/TatE family subunit [Candidatus Poseidoniia archaeon]|jgi:sec-independent protein translocase protein TatA|nr:twin-arginine translocase TatA/TatE family subunit [Candidatus Poseidoniia archaeon]MDP6846865.1 twin-arginine translocase TatA/TatE family subunit [Candidatus Poseidoniia archaeon]MDP7007073.1 twin-arginine translocase TatA/TatE family subunit [Candidatus Poseidoniia archaeon]